MPDEQIERAPGLNAYERRALELFNQGRSIAQVAAAVNRSQAAVNACRSKIKAKFADQSKWPAVATKRPVQH